jgi:ABC-2 type transport system permease protein
MGALQIAWKDLRIAARDRGWVIELFLLPLLFIFILSGAMSSLAGAEPGDERMALAVVDLDGGPGATRLVTELEATGRLRVEWLDEDEATAELRRRELARMLVLPAGVSAALAEGEPATLRLVTHPDADAEHTELARTLIDGAVRRLLLEGQVAASVAALAAEGAIDPAVAEGVVAGDLVAQVQDRPLLRVDVRPPQTAEGAEEPMGFPDAIQMAVSGFLVLFMFLAAQATARSIYEEKRVGSFRRLLAAPMGRAALLGGKMLANGLTCLIQAAVILAFGLVGLRWLGLAPISMAHAPGAVVLLVVAVALCSTALGLLLAALAKTEAQIGGLGSLILWGAGVLGGSFVPLFLLERYLGPVMQLVPHYWANRAFQDVIIRGMGWAGIITEVAVLLGFAAVFAGVGVWRFRFE